jgi:pimeloyl-ACP methyl ester carboxylesterase
MTVIFLVHGGLWDDPMNADRFWYRPGIVDGLTRRGFEVCWPDRLRRASGWPAEADHLSVALAGVGPPVVVVAGSNGCSAAVRLALDQPDRIVGLLLAWPATAADPTVDQRTRAGLAEAGAPDQVIDALLAGGTLRGVTDDELVTLAMPVGVLPSVPDNPVHQRRTVEALRHLLPGAVELPGCPEPPHPSFAGQVEVLVASVAGFANAVTAQPPASPAPRPPASPAPRPT